MRPCIWLTLICLHKGGRFLMSSTLLRFLISIFGQLRLCNISHDITVPNLDVASGAILSYARGVLVHAQ